MNNQLIVLKIGGSLGTLECNSFASAITELRDLGYQVVVVHGGGPRITEFLAEAGVESEFVDGKRKTPISAMPHVIAALTEVQQELLNQLQGANLRAQALAGFECVEAVPTHSGYATGTVTCVRAQHILELVEQGVIPLLSPLGKGLDGLCLNVNADLVASSVALAVDAKRLVYLTDVPGIYLDVQQQIAMDWLTAVELHQRLKKNEFQGGMAVKVEAVLEAALSGVECAVVLGRDACAVARGATLALHEFGNRWGGTFIAPIEIGGECVEP